MEGEEIIYYTLFIVILFLIFVNPFVIEGLINGELTYGYMGLGDIRPVEAIFNSYTDMNFYILAMVVVFVGVILGYNLVSISLRIKIFRRYPSKGRNLHVLGTIFVFIAVILNPLYFLSYNLEITALSPDNIPLDS